MYEVRGNLNFSGDARFSLCEFNKTHYIRESDGDVCDIRTVLGVSYRLILLLKKPVVCVLFQALDD